MNNSMTTNEAAKRLGISVGRVRKLIYAGKLNAIKLGRDWVIQEQELEDVKVYGKAGRPKSK